MFVYALTILVSAFLLFQVQPVIAKIILPWFGGSAAVWTTCLLFFQVVLLLGYLYAHLLFRCFKPRVQAVIHIALLLVSLLALPIMPGAGWKPSGEEDPTLRILLLLSASVGLPYFLLSTTGPLVQGWYALRFKGAMPYRLYALSNLGSMVGLLSYPVLFEPVFTTQQQGLGWSVGYGAFVLACGVTAFVVRGAAAETTAEFKDVPHPARWLYFFWIGLPACASALLLASTNHLSQNVAAIPFLWVLPLSLYLLSFILCFERAAWYRRNPFLQLLAVALGSMAYGLSEDFENTSIKVLIPLFSVGLFIACMVCHGELARLKPHPRYLTSYYVMISVGGALGGVFVGLIAPNLFQGYFELQICLAACAVLVLVVLCMDPESQFYGGWRRPATLAAAAMALALIVYVGIQIRQNSKGYRVMVRNFYGGLRVMDDSPGEPDNLRKLLHGTIDHGEQFTSDERRRQPTTYYGPQSGVGLAIRERQPAGSMRVGVIGLGTGTLAAYGRPGDYYRFYEINPLVIDLARSEFTFLKDSWAKVDVALGDARLSLESEQPGQYDVLAVDAFSGDSIPVHLLTREAMRLYFRHLRPDGVLAVHVSNKYLDLQPVVRKLADDLHLSAMTVDTEDDDDYNGIFGSTWVLVTARPGFFEAPEVKAAAAEVDGNPSLRLWTDDYSNLFQILK